MSDLTGGIDSDFFLTLATFFGGVGLITRYAYKSKCFRVELCCIKIERDIEEMKHQPSSSIA